MIQVYVQGMWAKTVEHIFLQLFLYYLSINFQECAPLVQEHAFSVSAVSTTMRRILTSLLSITSVWPLPGSTPDGLWLS